MSKRRKKQIVMALFILLSAKVVSDPTPIADEAFLLFLADMVEVDGELTDGMDVASIELDNTSIKKTEQNEAQEAFEEAEDI